ncbi:hypothetical protein TIFTF001_045830 [Ficus carica]|uniref:Uncharacterized protein n=1 Tax=Ficus carica TaxID=3494 RepID=A0AA88CN20_FICCA|nr:hypothetical protein TIFTF001_045830 [Ficus carica]
MYFMIIPYVIFVCGRFSAKPCRKRGDGRCTNYAVDQYSGNDTGGSGNHGGGDGHHGHGHGGGCGGGGGGGGCGGCGGSNT